MYPYFSLINQQAQPEVPTLVPGLWDKIMNIFYTLYNHLEQFMIFILQQNETFRVNPELAFYFGGIATLLTVITVIFILTVFESVRKVVGGILVVVWILFLISVLLKIG